VTRIGPVIAVVPGALALAAAVLVGSELDVWFDITPALAVY